MLSTLLGNNIGQVNSSCYITCESSVPVCALFKTCECFPNFATILVLLEYIWNGVIILTRSVQLWILISLGIALSIAFLSFEYRCFQSGTTTFQTKIQKISQVGIKANSVLGMNFFMVTDVVYGGKKIFRKYPIIFTKIQSADI